MKKRILSILLIALMLVALIPSTAFAAVSGKWGSNITWKNTGYVLVISGKGAMKAPDENNIPPWFMMEGLERIEIKEGVTTLPDFIFMGTRSEAGGLLGTSQLFEIDIPASVKEISPYAFIGCVCLTNIDVDPENQYYSDNDGVLFNKEQTELLWVPNHSGNTLIIPNTVERIYVDSILSNYSLSWFVVEEGNTVFETDDKSNLYDKTTNTLVMVCKGADGTHKVKEGTKAIADIAFYSCKEIWEIDIPEGVSVIEPLSFYDCQQLRTIWLPSTITSIGEEAFGECSELKDVYFKGTKATWEKIVIAEGNENLLNANIHFYCDEHADFVEVDAAYCTKPQLLKCSECAYTIVGDPPLGHSELIEPAIEATCTEYGRTEGIFCSRCHNYVKKWESIRPLGHDKIPVPAVEPTCTATGLTEGEKCSRCDEIFVVQQVVPTTKHSYEWTIIKEATQTEAGERKGVCSVCGNETTESYNLYDLGDVNKDGYINALDATQILRHANGKTSVMADMTEAEKLGIADVNKDGYVNALDATQILRYANGKSSVLN